ncbi:polysaccharide biosynthesis protein GumN [Salipiger aestuarii]|uniref:TraB family protein n=1 Tax=Salipiger aestuarii TaxID=568098 RepID=A0A327YIB0_9RHOB|nr:TraB/GumN family protein [Salipiger aestuarii]EIE52171.1 GumN family protein [Citreicella sp. 357]KAA8608425.1 polysaccharide biosynthesis protein GumN [Salipiger aestuarii]KAB2541430.1 polysaccharide biosynthesis protein GumN [Salipiger aestuarii]RAK20082.1 hypothetical protein ATI53_100783 [Salipiger aestuarii]
MLRPLLVALAALGGAAQAQCAGDDLRKTLSDDESATLQRLVDATPYAEGNRWRAEKDGEIIRLVGTMHLSDPRLDRPADRLRPVLKDAGALLLEMPADEQARLMTALTEDPGLILLTDSSLPDLMPDRAWQTLASAARDRGLPAAMAAKMRPWYLSMLLSVPACAQAQLQEQDGLDARLEALATEYGVPTLALEPFDTTFEIFNAEPLEGQIEMIAASLAEQEDGENGMSTTIAAYFDEKAGEMWRLSEILVARSDMYTEDEAADLMAQSTEALLSTRNRAWIPVILDTAARHEAPIVAAFGAAHLPGTEGILQLLADDGWTLTREPF